MERVLLLLCCELIIAIGYCGGSPNHNHRPVCWKAILKCHGEPECRYAYDQYLHACASVISGVRKKCPSHCISSLIQLNLTRTGPDLEDCDCATDPVCRSTKQAIDPCVPRTSTMGCTEARLQCETDPACSSAMRDYLFHCRKLFGGQRCSESCRKMIANMRSIPKAQQLDVCICDGTERNICEYIKLSMKTLCTDSSDRLAGSGFSDSEEDTEEDYIYQDDYQHAEHSSSPPTYQKHLKTLTFMVIFTRFI
ncbi:hypothetical protein ILYODFUR_023224 [Ilyodon furcidens]|uniref:GDNF/GAS1 domain-containing protein n=1 Tax=Ilyodon furcidens TaxID=33524 RepID=A0ABV0T2M7_9TELE